ncbi:unnamed protein product [Bursaphelenchus okinawaensis]|uniref:DOMON domain-containing protein n=1 Tax=Bursaphelenchus okinawaensis TaxID=465554 RepID=A0A811LHT0_9BILA|nr:unnamed protein product [Bursaphelenchus okinawaensis]CAG9122312.1 unnamed protein product [Bursaphelenchus okinawaensis]
MLYYNLIFICALFLCILIVPVFGGNQIYAKLKHHEVLVNWKVLWESQEIKFDVAIRGKSFKWFGFGFSDHGKWEGSDLCTWKRDEKFLKDSHIRSNLFIHTDAHQDCRMLRTSRKHNRIQFIRKMVTCDSRDYAIEFGTTQFLIAIAPQVPITLNSSYVEKRIYYSSILEKTVPQTVLEEQTRVVNITAVNAQVPAVVTSYWCGLLELPDYLKHKKHHAVRFSALITNGNEDIVHHMEIYNCYQPIPKGVRYNGNCMQKPQILKSCSKVVAAWAFGAETLDYPKEAGMPIGGQNYVPYLMVEIHYNNLFKHEHRIDNSGFTITVTSQLRRYDAGITEYGLIYSDANSIPPRQKDFTMSGVCVPECTRHLPKDGILIFATQQHAHLTGRKIRTIHYRNGVKLGYINFDDHYTAHWQVIRRLEDHIHVLPGDVIQTTCSFETEHLNRWTWGGYGIEDEMCVNYMFYYPAADIEVCKTAISNVTLNEFFKKHLPMENLTGLGIHEKYEKLDLYPELVEELSEWYDLKPLNVDCLDHSGQRFEGQDWEYVSQPEMFGGSYEKRRSAMECPAINR